MPSKLKNERLILTHREATLTVGKKKEITLLYDTSERETYKLIGKIKIIIFRNTYDSSVDNESLKIYRPCCKKKFFFI